MNNANNTQAVNDSFMLISLIVIISIANDNAINYHHSFLVHFGNSVSSRSYLRRHFNIGLQLYSNLGSLGDYCVKEWCPLPMGMG